MQHLFLCISDIYDIELDHAEYLKDWKLLMISDVFCTLVLKYAIAF